MKELNFATGLVTYSVNGGAAEVTFNPTDPAFVERLFNTFNALDEKQEAYQAEADRTGDKREVFAMARRRDEEMRAMLDEVFASPVSGPLFGTMNVYALAEGLPAWANLMLTVMDEIDTSFAREQKATNPRLQKYLDKWQKK